MVLKQRPTLKQASLIPTIRNMILPEYYPSILVVVLYMEAKTTSVAMIDKKEPEIIIRVSCPSLRCGHISHIQKPRGEKSAIIIKHMGL